VRPVCVTATASQWATGVGGARIVCAQTILATLDEDGAPVARPLNITTNGKLFSQLAKGFPQAYLGITNNDVGAAATMVVGGTVLPS
jgi:hypothetical protein